MRTCIPLLFLLFCCINALKAQKSRILHKRISIELEEERLKTVLSKIESQAQFSFSYSGELLNADSLVSLHIKNAAVWEILDKLFKNNIDYREIDDFVVLRPTVFRFFIEAGEIEADQRQYIIKGEVLDAKTGLGVKNASVYEKRLLKSTLTDKNGVFKLKFKGEHRSVVLTASKEQYRDTTVFFLSDIKVRPEGMGEDKEKKLRLNGFGFSNVVEHTGFGRFLISSKRRIQSINIQEFFVNNKVQASFLPGLGSQGFMSSQVVNTFSFNVLGGYSAGTKGFESAGLFNLTKQDVVGGFQMAGLLNQVGGDVNGVQLSGIANLIHGKFNGFQMGGLYNKVRIGFDGMQVSGIVNQVNERLKGIQFTGVVNHVNGSASGIQLSGVFNHVKQNLSGIQFTGIFNKASDGKGVQISGVINIARKLRGLQFGVVNIADSISGAGIGLVNIYKNGYRKWGFYINENLSQQVSFKSGTNKLYAILEIGRNWRLNEATLYNAGFGFGHDFILNADLLLNIELQGSTFFDRNMKALGNANKVNIGLERKMTKHFGLMAGINYQLYTADSVQVNVRPYPGWASQINEKQSAWLGGKLGVVYTL